MRLRNQRHRVRYRNGQAAGLGREAGPRSPRGRNQPPPPCLPPLERLSALAQAWGWTHHCCELVELGPQVSAPEVDIGGFVPHLVAAGTRAEGPCGQSEAGRGWGMNAQGEGSRTERQGHRCQERGIEVERGPGSPERGVGMKEREPGGGWVPGGAGPGSSASRDRGWRQGSGQNGPRSNHALALTTRQHGAQRSVVTGQLGWTQSLVLSRAWETLASSTKH